MRRRLTTQTIQIDYDINGFSTVASSVLGAGQFAAFLIKHPDDPITGQVTTFRVMSNGAQTGGNWKADIAFGLYNPHQDCEVSFGGYTTGYKLANMQAAMGGHTSSCRARGYLQG